MNIDNGASHLFTRRVQTLNQPGRTESAASFTASQAGKTEGASESKDIPGIKKINFTNMTREEVRDWTNEQVRSGQMNLDDSFPFMAMTMKIPVGGGREIPAAGDNERIDFMQRAHQGIEGALSRQDFQAAKSLEMTLDIMQKNQGQTIGIDIRA